MARQNLLARRQKTLQQRQKRLSQAEAALNTQLRKQQTRHLITLGGLVVKAGLADWPSETLLGGLLALNEQSRHPHRKDTWTDQGRLALMETSRSRLPVRVTFETPPNAVLQSALKTLGLTWSPEDKSWQGTSDPHRLDQLFTPHGGVVHIFETTSGTFTPYTQQAQKIPE